MFCFGVFPNGDLFAGTHVSGVFKLLSISSRAVLSAIGPKIRAMIGHSQNLKLVRPLACFEIAPPPQPSQAAERGLRGWKLP